MLDLTALKSLNAYIFDDDLELWLFSNGKTSTSERFLVDKLDAYHPVGQHIEIYFKHGPHTIIPIDFIEE